MLTLLTKNYKHADYQNLIYILTTGRGAITCSQSCDNCKNAESCADIERLLKFCYAKVERMGALENDK